MRINYDNTIIIFFLFLITNLYIYSNALERIWIIRHCDKDNNSGNCCNKHGYKRALSWNKYFSYYIREKFIIYTADFYLKTNAKTNLCIDYNNNYNINYNNNYNLNCQKSQRMYITSYLLCKSMFNCLNINNNYCVNQIKELIIEIKKQKINDIIIVWSHREIITLINKLGINNIKKWSSDIDGYNVIFMITINNGNKINANKINVDKIYYDCYNFETNTLNCNKQIENKWLSNIPKISNYFNNNFEGFEIVNNINNITSDYFNSTSIPRNKTNNILNIILITFNLTVLILTIFIIIKKYISYYKINFTSLFRKTPKTNNFIRILQNEKTPLIDLRSIELKYYKSNELNI